MKGGKQSCGNAARWSQKDKEVAIRAAASIGCRRTIGGQ